MKAGRRVNQLKKSDRGAVLLIVLWVLVAVAILGVSFSAAVRTEVNAARNVVDQKQAYYLARAGVEYSVYKLLESRSAFAAVQQQQEGQFDQLPEILTGQSTLNLPGGSAVVKVLDETGKINLNAQPDQNFIDTLYNLLIVVGVDAQQAEVITDSILDWRDPDFEPGPAGAEDDYYLSLEEQYRAKNGFFDVPDELLLVRGVTPEIFYGRKGRNENGDPVDFYGLQNYVTTFGNSGAINVNSAPLPVLAALPFMDYQMAVQIFSAREQGPFLDLADLMQRVPGLPTNVAQYLTPNLLNSVYTLVSEGRIEGSNVVSRIHCVVQIDGLGPKGYSVIYWNEAVTEI